MDEIPECPKNEWVAVRFFLLVFMVVLTMHGCVHDSLSKRIATLEQRLPPEQEAKGK